MIVPIDPMKDIRPVRKVTNLELAGSLAFVFLLSGAAFLLPQDVSIQNRPVLYGTILIVSVLVSCAIYFLQKRLDKNNWLSQDGSPRARNLFGAILTLMVLCTGSVIVYAAIEQTQSLRVGAFFFGACMACVTLASFFRWRMKYGFLVSYGIGFIVTLVASLLVAVVVSTY